MHNLGNTAVRSIDPGKKNVWSLDELYTHLDVYTTGTQQLLSEGRDMSEAMFCIWFQGMITWKN